MAKKDDKNYDEGGSGLTIPISSIILSDTNKDGQTKQKKGEISQDKLRSILLDRTKKLNDADGIMELLTDSRIAMEILTSQTLSPKDLSHVPFRLKVDKAVYDGTVDAQLIEDLQAHFTTIYDLEAKLPKIVNEALFTKGAWVTLLLPPDEIDTLISGGLDNTLALESLTSGFNQSKDLFEKSETSKDRLDKLGLDGITTNLSVLRRPKIESGKLHNKVNALTMESMGYNVALSQSADERFKKVATLGLKKPRRPEEYRNNPIPIKVPADAILPIPEPSNPEEHIYYLIPIDEKGNIVSKATDSDYVGDLEAKIKESMAQMTNTNNKSDPNGYSGYQIVKGAVSDGDTKRDTDPGDFIEAYKLAVEKPIIEALKNNDIVDDSIDLKGDSSFYRIMLARALKKKKTRILVVPADYVCYIAFDYNTLGQGVSLIEKNMFWASLRAVLKIADMMAAVTNAIPGTEYEVTFDETDEDPVGTIEMLMHELAAFSASSFPIGSTNPSDIITSIQRAATRLKINGGEKYANTSIEKTDTQRQRARMDSDLDESTKRMYFTGLGVPVEAVDRLLEGETATGLILSDLMAAKRAMERQGILRRHVEHLIRLYIMLSPDLYGRIKNVVKNQNKVDDFIWSLRLSLPTADASQIEQIASVYDNVSRFIDDATQAYITDDMLRGLVGNTEVVRDALDDFRNIIAAQLKRDYIRDNNLYPELENIVTDDAETGISGKVADYYKKFFENYGDVAKKILEHAKKADQVMSKAQNDGDDQGGSGGGFGGSSFGGGFGGGFGTSGAATPFDDEGNTPFSGDDFGGGDVEGPQEPEPEEEPEEDEVPTEEPEEETPEGEEPEEEETPADDEGDEPEEDQ